METKGVTCKIPLELHNRISEEIRASGSTMSKFIEMVINAFYEEKEKGDQVMGKTRTMAFQISEELFQKIKEYLAEYERVYHRRLTQKEFVIGLVEQALEEAPEEFEAAREAQGSHFSPDSPLLHRQPDAGDENGREESDGAEEAEESDAEETGPEETEDVDDDSVAPEDAEGDDEDGDDPEETEDSDGDEAAPEDADDTDAEETDPEDDEDEGDPAE